MILYFLTQIIIIEGFLICPLRELMMLCQACLAQELLQIGLVETHVFALVKSVYSTVFFCWISCKSTWLLRLYALLALHANVYGRILLKIIKILFSLLSWRFQFSAAELCLFLLLSIIKLLSDWNNIFVVLRDPILHFTHHFNRASELVHI